MYVLQNHCQNTYFTENNIPKVWRQSRIIAILQRAINQSHSYDVIPIKLYERLILNRINPTVESYLIKEQAGFRTGRLCTSQLLNLTQHIEDSYQNRMITGAAFIDLSAAYDTVTHRILIQKIFNTTQDRPLCRVIYTMLSSRRFYVELFSVKHVFYTSSV